MAAKTSADLPAIILMPHLQKWHMEHVVFVRDIACKVRLHSEAERRWLAVGLYSRERVSVHGVTKSDALLGWRDAVLERAALSEKKSKRGFAAVSPVRSERLLR